MAKYYTPTKLSENMRETPEGFLLCLGVPIARTGWQEYGEGETPLESGDDGKVHIYRASDEVFRPETMASFEGKSVTIRHPKEFVDPSNWSYLSKGILQNIRKAKEFDDDGEEVLLADLLITEAMAIQLVKNGLREVSCGYEAEYEQTEIGKGLQTNIVGNHLALVEEGRAGAAYAINDQKGKTMSKMIDNLKKKFGAKAVDEAMAEEKKDESKDAASYDELVKVVKDLSAKIDGMGKAKDEEKPAEKKEEEKKPAAKDEEKPAEKKEEEKSEDEEAGSKLEERLSALETAVAKLLEKAGDEKEDEEKSEDESEEGEEKSEDEESDISGSESEDEENEEKKDDKKAKFGDTASRAEILSPGIKASKDIKVEALKAAYQTKDGKEVIHMFTGGKAPELKDKEKVETLFVAVSEVLKAKRGSGLAGTKDGRAFDSSESNKNGLMTPEKMNELNAAHWARK